MVDKTGPDDAIAHELQRLLDESKQLRIENEMYEAFLQLHEAKHGPSENEDDSKAQKKKGNKKRVELISVTQQKPLAEDEKAEVAHEALEHLVHIVAQKRAAGEKQVDELHTLAEECDESLREVRRWAMQFKRDVIIEGENPLTGKTSAEKLIRFIEERLSERQLLLEKLDLRHRTVRITLGKLEAQRAHDAEVGEVLHAVDFEQLKIDNVQQSERIQQKNTELLQLKLIGSKTIQMLNEKKIELSKLTKGNKALVATISNFKKKLAAFDEEFCYTNFHCAAADEMLTKLKEEQGNVENPSILDYIKVKQEVCDLEKQICDIKRKNEILEREGKRATSALTQVKTLRNTASGWLPPVAMTGTGTLARSLRTRS